MKLIIIAHAEVQYNSAATLGCTIATYSLLTGYLPQFKCFVQLYTKSHSRVMGKQVHG